MVCYGLKNQFQQKVENCKKNLILSNTNTVDFFLFKVILTLVIQDLKEEKKKEKNDDDQEFKVEKGKKENNRPS